ncbi:AraC family transcriptional regulator [Halioxenophilus sp. WMMB6]|uniref:AraC family transcriptional regulator n=1 Tax=Halioxenophilus sp. WMMB6 TaxID=3073815 RepID=UPI00295E6A93|nr:AraC family transcriptional regulator [Halioxenophilus sp. WMMB6]
MTRRIVSNTEIIADAIGRGPDISIKSATGNWELSRWRQFVGDYTLPALTAPVYTVHLAGKPSVKTWIEKRWSDEYSIPGCSTIVPAGHKTGWLVNGELDVVTLSLSEDQLKGVPAEEQFKRMRFAFSDRLSAALTNQVVSELYETRDEEDDEYIRSLINALVAHIMRGSKIPSIPINTFSANRIHQVIDTISSHPDRMFSVKDLADQVGVTMAHFSRIFKQGTGLAPHQFILKAKVTRAQYLLSQTTLPINTIADQLGFSSQSQFSRAFRSFTGFSPRDYRVRTSASIN